MIVTHYHKVQACVQDQSPQNTPYWKHLEIQSADVLMFFRSFFRWYFQSCLNKRKKSCLGSNKNTHTQWNSNLRWQYESDITMLPTSYWCTATNQHFLPHFPFFSTCFRIIPISFDLFTLSLQCICSDNQLDKINSGK